MPRHPLDQLPLFSKQLQWKEFPPDVRQQLCQLLAELCLDIVKDYPEEQKHEPRVNSILAP